MSRHISIFFQQVKRNGLFFFVEAQFKKKFSKLLIQAHLDLVAFLLYPPSRVVTADISPYLILIDRRRIPVHPLFGRIIHLKTKWLTGGGLQPGYMLRLG